jgi:hypothetical protein
VIHLRSACAWTLLAMFAFGGTAAPAVHRAVHGLEREATLAGHTADGHHAGESAGHHVREACATTAARDLACTLCSGVSASVVVRTDRPFVAVVERKGVAAGPFRPVGRSVAEPSSRGPPARVA